MLAAFEQKSELNVIEDWACKNRKVSMQRLLACGWRFQRNGGAMSESEPVSLREGFAPVSDLGWSEATSALEEGIALCLSGGGYRAMLFHTGVLWRLHHCDILRTVKRVSSVSGGTIAAALLAKKWDAIYGAGAADSSFVDEFVTPIRKFADMSVDVSSIGKGTLLPGTISSYVADAYDEHLFHGATLQSISDSAPRFVFNATNVQSGALWRFSKPYMGDYLVGRVENPEVRLADVTAASSAFPPFLSPAKLIAKDWSWLPVTSEPLHKKPFTETVVLTDGGVYDNLGLETAWKRYSIILVSDAGQKMDPEGAPDEDWARHAKRVLDLVDNQVRSLRKRQLIESLRTGLRKGAYWGIRTDVRRYEVSSLPCPIDRTQALANIATRLTALDDLTQERLINWGYAVCDAALRANFDAELTPAGAFPYEKSAV
jgi:NTE family protein